MTQIFILMTRRSFVKRFNLGEIKKMVKKQLIMEKSLELFAEQGFEATSVQQITKRCGISKGAFYLSFKSKEELILALIDQFMEQFLSNIDYTVRNAKNNENLLYDFYYISFASFNKYSNFAKIFMKEQAHSVNNEMFTKLHYYYQLHEKAILAMVEKLYGDEVNEIKYDLVYCIKSFMRTYTELLLFSNTLPDLETLAQSLAEKTNILAKHMTIPYVTHGFVPLFTHPQNEEGTKEEIIRFIDQSLEEVEESIEKESLVLLKEELLTPTLSQALIKGLIENIRNHPQCIWTAYLLRNYYNF